MDFDFLSGNLLAIFEYIADFITGNAATKDNRLVQVWQPDPGWLNCNFLGTQNNEFSSGGQKTNKVCI